MRKTVEKILRRYGTPVVLRKAGVETTLYGFVQHTATSADKYILPEYTPLGEIPQGRYLMMLPLLPEIERGDTLVQDGRCYAVRRVEKVWHGVEAIYRWCLCEEEGGADQWGNQS